MFRLKSTRSLILLGAVLVICLFIVSNSGLAAVEEATFFPNSATVEEATKIHVQSLGDGRHRAVFLLPSQADPESLRVLPPSPGGVKIEDIQVKSVARVDENKVAQLRAQLKKIQSEGKDLQAKLQTLDMQLQFWQAQTKANTKNVAEADLLSSAIGKNSRKIFSERNDLQAELEKIDKQIQDLQNSIGQTAGKAEKAWEASVSLAGAVDGDLTLRYRYTLGSCGWQPLYRLEAIPASQSILFSWDAQIWQSTGSDWKQTKIRLATYQPSQAIAPRDLPAWIIKPQSPVVYKSARMSKSARAELESIAPADIAFAAPAPEETLRANYAVWSLGKKTVAAGEKQRIKIKEETWPVSFLLVARPSLSAQAFYMAKIQLPKPVDIPSGPATFVMDGAIVGKRTFALAGTDADIFFGVNPFVTVDLSTVTDQSGATRIFQTQQTRRWQWLIEAKNSGSSAVKLRIEEPIARSRDERIKLTYQNRPEPSQQDKDKFIWLLDIPAKGRANVETGVELEAPKEMDLDFGWRR